MDITEVSIIHHAGIVLLGLWLLSEFNLCHPVAYFISLIYLYLVHERYMVRLQKKLQFEERKKSYQRRVLADSETVRWLNHAVEKIWPVCMEQIASQKILLPIIPWFLEKYKPWTAKKAVVQHLYLGRNPPIFTEMRVLRQGSEDDHLVLELGMNFLTAEDMSAILAVKLRKRLGFGMWARLNITGMHVEGKVLIGVKFVQGWPFLGRLRVCFAEPPYFQMTVKPIFTHGIDVTEVPGIAGWLDNLLSVAFEQTLVQPNMLVVDVEKFAAPQQVSEPWFSVDVKDPVAFVKVEVIEAADMRPADLNGLADPYVKGQMGPYRFTTKIQKKTLSPKWLEEFRIPIVTWETPNVLNFKVCDKDHIFDDALGKCSVDVNDLRDGRRHDTWVPLQDVKLGRLHLAITVLEENGKGDPSVQGDADSSIGESLCTEEKLGSSAAERASGGSFSSRSSDKSSRLADKFEPIDVEGQKETGIWIQQPGSEVSHTWEPRKGKTRHIDTEIIREQNDPLATDPAKTPGGTAHERKHSENPVGKFLGKFVSVFHRAPKKDDRVNTGEAVPSPHVNVRETSTSKTGVNLIVKKDLSLSHEGKGSESPGEEDVKDKAEAFPEQAEKPERSLEPALLEKGPGRSHGGDSSVGNVPSDSESTDDESLPPSIHMPGVDKDNTIEITSQPISSDGAGGTPKSMEMGGVSTDQSEITADSGNAMKEEGGGSVDDVSSPELLITTAMEGKGVNLDGITG